MFSKLKTIVIAFLTLLLTLAIVSFPEQVLIASVHGLKVWWEIVFPSLLPFFIMAELLTSFGIVQFFGVLFEPVMRPLFNVRGVGSFAWILGMVSGFPSGAKITVLLRKKMKFHESKRNDCYHFRTLQALCLFLERSPSDFSKTSNSGSSSH